VSVTNIEIHSTNTTEANDRLNKPNITSTSRGHVYEGDNFELVCELSAPHGVDYQMRWIIPEKVDEVSL